MPSDQDLPAFVRASATLTIRRATMDDLDVLAAWFSDPSVYEYWGGEPIRADVVREKYVGERYPEVVSYIVEEAGLPVGYAQFWDDGDDPARGFDMVLTAQARGRGLGPQAARALALAFTAAGWSDLTVDPQLTNQQAIAAWTKAGFVDTGQRSFDEGETTMILIFTPNADLD